LVIRVVRAIRGYALLLAFARGHFIKAVLVSVRGYDASRGRVKSFWPLNFPGISCMFRGCNGFK
jgi:hypothetical protein